MKVETPMEQMIRPCDLRPAQTGDSLIIHSACRMVWPEEDFKVQQIQEALADPQHAAVIAVKNGCVTGFVDGFMTTSAGGLKRWEVDLLGVVRAHRGRGIGLQLVQANLSRARVFQPQIARALIRTDNTTSQVVFKRAGFLETENAVDLYCSRNPTGSPASLAPGAALVPVRTFSYNGFWLEGELSESAFLAARSFLTDGGDLVGCLIESGDIAGHQVAAKAEFNFINTYRWWFYSWQETA